MASTKVVTVLANNVTLTAGAANPVDSDVMDLQDGYGAFLQIKVTNGATGPTLAAQAQIQTSPDKTSP